MTAASKGDLKEAHHVASHAHLPSQLARVPVHLLFRIHFPLPLAQALAPLHSSCS